MNRSTSSALAVPRRRLALLLVPLLVLAAAVLARSDGAGAARTQSGYWMLTADGHVYNFGGAAKLGEPSEHGNLHSDIEATPSGDGFWVLRAGGTVTKFGDAAEIGGGSKLPAGEKFVSLSATPDGLGYWLFTSAGRVQALGTAKPFGDMADKKLNAPVLDSVATPTGKGYWMVAADGGIFTFGDAKFFGSTGNMKLNQPVISMAPDPDGAGYWLVASDGGIFSFDAPFVGSMGSVKLNKPISGMVGGDGGYLMVAEDGGIFAFGAADFHGSLGASPPASKVVSVAVVAKPKPPITILPTPTTTAPPTTTTQPPGSTTTTTGGSVPDTTAPTTTIITTADTFGPHPAFGFSSNEAGATFECRIEGDWAPCTSGQSFGPFEDGDYTFAVRARDAAGNVDSSPDDLDFEVDATGPEVVIDSPGEGGPPVGTTLTAAFHAADNDAVRFHCAVDSGPLTVCSSGDVLATDLAPGSHTFTVYGFDEFDNPGIGVSRNFVA